ncbi:HsdR family type I site-specific deoxyribonuclease [Candidatus Oleimmundimicrobium sp.]|uniref:type I restriction endonuclease subunit R n=1 Tax=Candidatus Oleimmundimicrobium sp. TaxID=3060597 RepID=UPI00271E3DE5|nr:HsdR family type I site-specific deoxyribonuclease [Candidatus Oleimmundimicrobium sp.]MDO8885964.1 HsdR family type I site-specific deoxyribonuclease [Candidatus Oleimmundimicrobium sp.]
MAFDEKILVEDYIVQKLQEKGWKFVPAEELERESYQEPLLVPNLIRAIEKINEKLDVGDEEINKVLNELKFAGTGMEGAKRILNLYKLGVPVKFERDRVLRAIQLFDYENIENNEFIVTRQVYYDGRERIRTDVVLYVNGIPLVNIECKNPTSISESWHNAYRQIKDYEKTVPELYKYVQIGVAAESKAKYFPIVPWQDDVKTNKWRENDLDSIDSTIEMLSRDTFLDILKHFLFFRIEFGNATKVVTRYMQYRAANKMVNRVLDNLEGKEEKNKGLIWHWQGSGKTLTMIFAANKLYYANALKNPTIFFIVDRIELEDQLYKEFNSMDIVEPEIIGSIDELKNVLSYDDYRGKRGVFIVLIHKFRPEELKELQRELAAVSKSKTTIMSRKNVVAFIDEGHRTQYGMLAVQMKAILKSAFFYALTGTPISKRGRDTYLEFSYPPKELYLDKYFITDSIEDGFTVKIVYQPRLEKKVYLKKELLEGFLEMAEEELPEHIKEDVEEKTKRKLNAIKLFLENPERIKLIAEDIAKHFKENVDGKFKAMVVAPSRKACALYKSELDKHLSRECSEVVMTMEERGEKEPVLQELVAESKVRYGYRDLKDVRKDAVEKFKEEESPKILIVTEMLLAGFDAPILQTMYLDKPLKEHRLLQAVARTNRPFNDFKEAGVVIDYVGVLKEFKKALEMYSEEDIADALQSYDGLREEFVTLIKETLELFKEVSRKYERETLLKAIEILTADEEKEKRFVEKYRQLRKVFELLGPDEVKLEHFEDYKWLSAIYTYYMKVVIQKPPYEKYVQKFYEKTIKFAHKSTEVEKLNRELPTITFDENYLKKLEEKVKDKKEAAANILFTLNKLVLVDRHRSPIYESLAERVERLLELWNEKTKDYERIYKEGAEIVNDVSALSARQRTLDFSNLEYSMLLILEEKLGEGDELVGEMKSLSGLLERRMFPGWIGQTTIKKEVEREVRRFVRGLKRKYKLSLEEMDNLYGKLIESVENYGAS